VLIQQQGTPGSGMTESTKFQQRPAHLWKPGTFGNPAGRPGSRNKLSEDFVAALYDDFQDHGRAAIAACRAEKPDVYVRVIADLLPKDMNINVQQLDDHLLRRLAALTEMAKPLLSKLSTIEGEAKDITFVGLDVGVTPEQPK
jgi:hypothetical protein